MRLKIRNILVGVALAGGLFAGAVAARKRR